MSSNSNAVAALGCDGRGAGVDPGDTNRRCGLFRGRRRYGGGVVCGTGRDGAQICDQSWRVGRRGDAGGRSMRAGQFQRIDPDPGIIAACVWA